METVAKIISSIRFSEFYLLNLIRITVDCGLGRILDYGFLSSQSSHSFHLQSPTCSLTAAGNHLNGRSHASLWNIMDDRYCPEAQLNTFGLAGVLVV
jgi:hypothetical protein